MTDIPEPADSHKWYEGITRYQWTVLVIASLGWVFDIFEGQVFVASMNEAMDSLVEEGAPVATYNYVALGAFLIGGAVGGIVFGMLSDRIGRKKAMSLTILFYSAFTCLSALSMTWWHLAAFRFLVAIGVGGEWAVASALVAEVFPQRARARVGGIFHASSVFGTYLATAAGVWIIGNPLFVSQDYPTLSWRLGFVVGAIPAFLILWIRRSLKEPESWHAARERARSGESAAMGRIGDLFQGDLARRTLVGVTLAAVGLATFWGAHIFGRNMMRRDATPYYVPVPSNARAGISSEVRSTHLAEVVAIAESDVAAQEGSDRNGGTGETLASNRRTELAEIAQSSYFQNDWRKVEFVQADGDGGGSSVVAVVPTPEGKQRLPIQDGLTDPEAAYLTELMKAVNVRINQKLKNWEMFGMLLATTGGGLGLLAFGPICERIGRRKAFLFYHIGGLVSALLTFQFVSGITPLIIVLPVFGFLTLGMHAGYAIYFPELYPTRLRGTGSGFCFNAARIVVPPMLILSGWLQDTRGVTPENAYSLMSLLYLVGVAILVIAPETKGQQLPE